MSDQLVLMLLGAVLAGFGGLWLVYQRTTDGRMSDAQTAHKAALDELRTQRDVYKAIADRAVARLEQEANDNRGLRGLPPFAPMAPVIPEHTSPVTERQKEDAEQATLRARVVAATLELDRGAPAILEPLEYEHGIEPTPLGPAAMTSPPVAPWAGEPAGGNIVAAKIGEAAEKVAEAADKLDEAAEAQKTQADSHRQEPSGPR